MVCVSMLIWYPIPISTKPMKKPGNIMMAQNRLPQVSMRKTAGIVPISKEPPPTKDI